VQKTPCSAMHRRKAHATAWSVVLVLALCARVARGGAEQQPEDAGEAVGAQRRFSNPRPAAVATIAGTGKLGRVNGDGREAATFYYPADLALSKGEKFIVVADSQNNQIRKIERPESRDWREPGAKVTTLAGSGLNGALDGVGTAASFWLPQGVAISPDEKKPWVAVADTVNNLIRKVDMNTGLVSTIAGSGVAGYKDGLNLTAMFLQPSSLRFTSTGSALVIADGGNSRIRWFNLSTGDVTTLVGSRIKTPKCGWGEFAASGSCPQGRCECNSEGEKPDYLLSQCSREDYDLLVDPTLLCHYGTPTATCTSGSPQVGGCTCKAPNTGTRCTKSTDCDSKGFCVGAPGLRDGAATEATFRGAIKFDISRDDKYLFVADPSNQVVRRVEIATGATTTVAGTPSISGNEDGPLEQVRFSKAKLAAPRAVAVSASGTWMAVLDSANAKVRVADFTTKQMTSVSGWLACAEGGYVVDGTCWTLAVCLCNASSPSFDTAAYCSDGANPKFLPSDGSVPCNCLMPNTRQTCTQDSMCAGGGKCASISVGYSDGSATAAQFLNPSGMVMSSNDELIIVADWGNHRIRVLDCGGPCDKANIILNTSVIVGGDDLSPAVRTRPGGPFVALATSILTYLLLRRA